MKRHLLILCAFILFGCKEEGVKQESLTLITSADNPPFESYETAGANPKIVGFDIDLAQAISKELGYALEVQDSDFAALIPALHSGRADFAMAALSVTPERLENIDFSNSYFQPENVLLSHKPIPSIYSFKGEKIGAQLGSTQELLLKEWKEEGLDIEIVTLNRLNDLVQEVLAGRIEAALIEGTPAQAFVAQHREDLIPSLIKAKSPKYAIAFQKDSPLREKFNEALTRLKKRGVLKKLKEKWLSQ